MDCNQQGQYIVTWNLAKVLKGKRFDYKIKKTVSDVVADQFTYDRPDQIVVTLPDDVYAEVRRPRLSNRFSQGNR